MKKRGKYRKSVFFVSFRREKGRIFYLLMKRKLHWSGWEFPKGAVEEGETMRDSLVRELAEETGQVPMKIIGFNVRGRYDYPKALDDRPGYAGQTYKLFAVELKQKEVHIDRIEHSSYKWVDFETALNLLTYPNQRKCLRIVNKKISS